MVKVIEKAKKPLLYVFLILYILFIILAVTYFTNNFWLEISNPSLYKEMNVANDLLLYAGFAGAIAFALMAIVGSIGRYNYYLSNLIVNTLACVGAMVMSLVSMIKQISILGPFNEEFDHLVTVTQEMEMSSTFKSAPSGDVIYLAVALSIVTIVISLLVIGVTVVKYLNTNKARQAKLANIENVEVNA